MEKTENLQSQDRTALLNEISTIATQYDMVRFLRKVTDVYDMHAFLVARVPCAVGQSLQSLSIISSWPAELVTRYDHSAMVESSPIFNRVRASTLPFAIDLEQQAAGKAGREADVLALFKPYKMVRFAMFPVADPEGQRAAVCFHGERSLLSEREMMELMVLAIHVNDRLFQIGRRPQRPGEALTDREIDCLNWTAAGKTSSEISNILGLSEHTVNHYLNRATRKLDTVNRTQAVAKALRTGIIS